jgi:hypothetical protein
VELARYTLKHPIGDGDGVIRVLTVKRRAKLGDFLECERRGWMLNGDVRDECETQWLAFWLWQLCGLTPPEYEELDFQDVEAMGPWLRPFVMTVPPKTGVASPPTSPIS